MRVTYLTVMSLVGIGTRRRIGAGRRRVGSMGRGRGRAIGTGMVRWVGVGVSRCRRRRRRRNRVADRRSGLEVLGCAFVCCFLGALIVMVVVVCVLAMLVVLGVCEIGQFLGRVHFVDVMLWVLAVLEDQTVRVDDYLVVVQLWTPHR